MGVRAVFPWTRGFRGAPLCCSGGPVSPTWLCPWRPSVAWVALLCTLLVLNLSNSQTALKPLWDFGNFRAECAKEHAEGMGAWGSVQDMEGSRLRTSSLHMSPELERVWDAYVARHRASLISPWDHKFLLYKPIEYTGHGNKLPGVATAFMLAILSNRTLLIDYNDCALERDCTISWSRFFEQPVEMDFARVIANYPAVNETLTGVTFEDSGANDINFLVDHEQKVSKWDEMQWIWGHGVYDWSAHLWLASPIHGPTLQGLFTPGHIFHAVAQLLKRPSHEIEDVVASMRTRFRKLTIGVQIRQTKADLWEPGSYTNRSYFDMAKVLQVREGIVDKDTAIYLATDSVAVRNAWVKHLENSSVALIMQPEDVVFNPNTLEGLERHTLPGLQTGMVEMFLLSHTDQLIMSRGSSFGSTAAAFGRLQPWVITKDGYYGSAISDPCCFHTRWLEQVFGEDFTPEFF